MLRIVQVSMRLPVLVGLAAMLVVSCSDDSKKSADGGVPITEPTLEVTYDPMVLTGLAGFRRLIELVPSPYNGLLLCLGCMQERGEDVPEVIRFFGERNKIFYVHFRNVVGTVPRYDEVFPNQGDGDMVVNLKTLHAVGYEQYVVPDHHIGLVDDSEWMHCSRAWQVGYIRGLMQALQI